MMARRGPGRPPSGSAEKTRQRILSVARGQLATQGFAATSMRGVAREAGVDPSLISHHFGDKKGLLVATLQLPVNPVEAISTALSGEIDNMGSRLVCAFLSTWDPHRKIFSAVLRSSIGGGGDPASTPVAQMAQNVIAEAIRENITGQDKELRAMLIVGQIVGLATTRYVARVHPVAETPIELVAKWYGPAIQAVLAPPD